MSYDEHLISMAGGDGDSDHLAAIEARAQAATEGLWRAGGSGVVADREYVAMGVRTDPDAAFIANAPTDIAHLLALVREQQAKLDRVLELAYWAGKRGWQIAPAALRSTINEASA